MVIEASETIGTEVSSRNSEVIHAGIYYPSNSRKAVHCVRGRERLYAYCRRHGVGHHRIGKLIVATSEVQRDTLGAIARQAAAKRCGGSPRAGVCRDPAPRTRTARRGSAPFTIDRHH